MPCAALAPQDSRHFLLPAPLGVPAGIRPTNRRKTIRHSFGMAALVIYHKKKACLGDMATYVPECRLSPIPASGDVFLLFSLPPAMEQF